MTKEKIYSFTKNNWILIALCAVAVGLHFFMLDKIPFGWNVDEAGTAYDAWSIAKYGTDRYGYSYPVLFFNYGGGGQSAMYTYMASVFVKVFGFSLFVVRIPAALMSLAVLFCGLAYLHVVSAGKKAKIIWIVLYTLTPYFFMSGRFGLDCNMMLGFASIFILSLTITLKNNYTFMYAISGLLGGMVLYTYSVSYIVMICFLCMMFIMLIIMRKLTFKNAIVFCIPLAICALPLILVQLINIFDKKTITIWKFTFVNLLSYRIGELGTPKISAIPAVLKSILLYDNLRYNTIPEFLTLYWISIPFFVIGFVKNITECAKAMVKRKYDSSCIVLLWFLAEVVVGTMIGARDVNTNRMNGVFFCVLFFVTDGIVTLLKFVKYKKAVEVSVGALYLIMSFFFFRNYFENEKDTIYMLFAPSIEQEMEEIASDDKLNNLPIYIDVGTRTYMYYFISTLLSDTIDDARNMYDKGNYIFGLPEEIDTGAGYILYGNDSYIDKLQSEGMRILQRENGKYLVIPAEPAN